MIRPVETNLDPSVFALLKARRRAWASGTQGKLTLLRRLQRHQAAGVLPRLTESNAEQSWNERLFAGVLGYRTLQAKIGKRGACHLWRHTMATLMLEGGADIRFIQATLGHVLLSTTQLYTQVSIRKLKQIHTATHSAATLDGQPRDAADDDDDNGATVDDLLGDLDAEDDNNGTADDDPEDGL